MECLEAQSRVQRKKPITENRTKLAGLRSSDNVLLAQRTSKQAVFT